MSIIFNRSELFRFERLVTKAGLTKNNPNQNVQFLSGPQGLTLLFMNGDFSMSFDIASTPLDAPFSLKWDDVKELAAKPEGEVRFDLIPDKAVAAWTIKGVPQQKPLDRYEINAVEPNLPTECQDIHHGYFDALANAARCADCDNHKYALGGAALAGDAAQIVATNGRIMLVQDGFKFPWEDLIICPIPKLFGSKELRELGKEPKIGSIPDHVYIESGPMKLWLKQIDGRFPNYRNIIPETETFTEITIDPKDAKFVIDRIENLPGSDKKPGVFFGVELCSDAKRGIFVRSYDETNATATELRLGRSTFLGYDVECAMDRHFLKAALQFGCLEIFLKEDEPLVGRRDGATFVWMPLSGEEPEFDRSNVLACDSVSDTPATISNTRVASSVTTAPDVIDVEAVGTGSVMDTAFATTMPAAENTASAKPKAERSRQAKTVPSKPGTTAAMLEKAILVSEGMRALLREQNALIRDLRAHKAAARKREQKLKATVAELKNFQTV